METVSCNVIYVDRSVARDRYLRRGDQHSDRDASLQESGHLAENIRLLLEVFGEVHLCNTGSSGLTQWLSLQEKSMVALKPTLFLIDTPYQDDIPEESLSRPPSPLSLLGREEEELYGLSLLRRVISESYVRNVAKLVVTVPIIGGPYGDDYGANEAGDKVVVGDRSSQGYQATNKRMLKKCLDLGATDVMASPMNAKCISNLEVLAYRAHLDAARDQKALIELRRGRKRSWVGIGEEKPFAYLREAMVSKLMSWICRIGSETEDVLASIKLSISAEKQAEITSAVGQWHFCAHDFTDDELIVAALVMFKHALSMPELEPWRIPTDQLHRFLLACRAAYNTFVPYHNFRHVVDVLQATFHFLVCIGSLPPYFSTTGLRAPSDPKSPIAELLQPFEALTLLITAIGHDVGHPGVNNGFLVTLNAPLAQLYNDRSVLESFHCAAYSQILRRYWPSAFCDSKMRNLMISSILSTDMGLHFDYMKKLADLQGKLPLMLGTESVRNEHRALACALLIKCADISNVTRRHDTATQWMHILSDEFSRQATMEGELEIPTSLMSEPKKDTLSLSTSQLKFMTLFALPLFQGVADILPAMQYCVDELLLNQDLFERIIREEHERQSSSPAALRETETKLSPKSLDFTTPPDPATEAHPAKGAVGTVPKVVEPDAAPDNTMQQTESFQKPQESPKRAANGRQTTDGSSAPNSGDWASQATSATTGKMPLSPSTQGTSIVSRDSFERPHSIPTVHLHPAESTTTIPESATKSQTNFRIDTFPPPLALDEEQHHEPPPPPPPMQNGHAPTTNGHGGKRNGGALDPADQSARQLKKKPSRLPTRLGRDQLLSMLLMIAGFPSDDGAE
ncbi:3',5'-cyclic-nucleotide phosphodiesterase [Collariella sp. IMI 366227]|nr:3',5'-cyclic-nucleotide phosphodiesterase [Collariella sp. IMI 366227]